MSSEFLHKLAQEIGRDKISEWTPEIIDKATNLYASLLKKEWELQTKKQE